MSVHCSHVLHGTFIQQQPAHGKAARSSTVKGFSTYKKILCYVEPPKSGPLTSFLSKLQGSLPIVSLVSRLASDGGGVGNDRIKYAEFISRVEKYQTKDGKRIFDAFSERYGKVSPFHR